MYLIKCIYFFSCFPSFLSYFSPISITKVCCTCYISILPEILANRRECDAESTGLLTFVCLLCFNGVLFVVNVKLIVWSSVVTNSTSCCHVKKSTFCPHSLLCAPCDSYKENLLFSHTLLLVPLSNGYEMCSVGGRIYSNLWKNVDYSYAFKA